jgi:hypothetical protein
MLPFDGYDLKARIFPGLILALPVLVDAVDAVPRLKSFGIFTATGVCGLALIYALGQVARWRGEAIEPELWRGWDGPPSTRVLRHRDGTFSDELKDLIRNALRNQFSVGLFTAAEEQKNPKQADRAIVDAFRQVREFLREHNPRGLWFQHNVEYGFSRNLLGCRVLWVIVSFGCIVFAVVYSTRSGASAINLASGIATLWLLCGLWLGWCLLPGATQRVADGYAELAWMAFLRISTQPASGKKARSKTVE